jgi:hypothetical protein
MKFEGGDPMSEGRSDVYWALVNLRSALEAADRANDEPLFGPHGMPRTFNLYDIVNEAIDREAGRRKKPLDTEN